ncbi:MAG: VOC family protein [Minwuia sp.]|uniref:VOC family protein n=1 Tax=Minwuia sp. TaxID=2493630 RepID=UPI003A875F74
MYSHVTVGSSDLERSRIFYDAIMEVLELPFAWEIEAEAFAYGKPMDTQFVINVPYDRQPPHRGNGWHCAFMAKDRDAVDAFFRAALTHGGTSEGSPGLRPHYHRDYYAAYVRDPDGNKLQAVCHRPPERS